MLFNELLKKELTNHNLEIKDLADRTGLSYQKIYSYVNGTIPNSNDLHIVCNELEINVDDITFDDLNISVTEAAKMMQKSPQFVKAMVKNGVFGYYDGSTFHIPRRKFEQYMGLVDNSYKFDEMITALTYALDIYTSKRVSN
jgi:transcriptional regulator with XRE-family HTH domain